jgi:hypothetical protein
VALTIFTDRKHHANVTNVRQVRSIMIATAQQMETIIPKYRRSFFDFIGATTFERDAVSPRRFFEGVFSSFSL